MVDKPQILKQICEILLQGQVENAQQIAQSQYPFEPVGKEGRKYTELEATKIFVRDGFIDRYSGQQLVFPGTLRLLSILLPEAFPYHPNWKFSDTHIMYWELFPTIDHVIPVTRGGVDAESNWVTTSQIRNSAKANWTLEELGWTLLPPGGSSEWDGLMKTYVELAQANEKLLTNNPYLARWYRAATIVLS